jgi:hypothetical protein
MNRKSWSRVCAVVVSLLLAWGVVPMAAGAAGDGLDGSIEVYLQGERIMFEQAQPVSKEGRVLVPFRKLFESLGYSVEWNDSGLVQQAVGKKDGSSIALTINETVAQVNGVDVLLDVPAQIVNGSTMVPLRFVSENSGHAVSYTSKDGIMRIQIGNGAGGGDGKQNGKTPAAGKAEPYVLKGTVTDASGEPLEGVTVFADNMLIYNSNLAGITDAEGSYRIELEQLAVTWNASAQLTREFNGRSYGFDLTSSVDQPFAGNTGAIRNFVWDEMGGELYLYAADYVHPYNDSLPPPDEADVELTLMPVGTLIDGSAGSTISTRGENFPGGFGLPDVPIGRYKVTAVYKPEGQQPVQMLIRVRNSGEFATSTEFVFESLTEFIHQAELEVKLP